MAPVALEKLHKNKPEDPNWLYQTSLLRPETTDIYVVVPNCWTISRKPKQTLFWLSKLFEMDFDVYRQSSKW